MKNVFACPIAHLVFTSALLPAAGLPAAKTILFLGDSITHSGQYIALAETVLLAETDRRYQILNLGLSSETVSGLSEDGHAGGKFPRPNLHERLERVLAKTRPDLVLACYGMNCGIYQPADERIFERFKDGIKSLREKTTAVGADIIHLTPPTFDPQQRHGEAPFYNDVLAAYGRWLLAQRTNGWQVIDIHGPMDARLAEMRRRDPAAFLAKDGIHPGPEGHWLMARQILSHWGVKCDFGIDDFTDPSGRFHALHALVAKRLHLLGAAYLTETGHSRPGVAEGLPLGEALRRSRDLDSQIELAATAARETRDPPPFPGTRSSWNGYDKYDFEVDGKPALVVVPRNPAPGRPWVWHGEFFGNRPAPDIALLDRGFHIAHMRVPNMLGSPGAVAHWNAFYRELTGKRGLGKRPALVGLSRGGLYCYNWAIANPDKVSCIYADAPVCDFKSWPGGKGEGKGDPTNWALVLRLWGFQSETEALAAGVNPIDNLAPLASAKVPLLHVFGDADDVVPWDENTGIVEKRYRDLGGPIALIRKPGVGHHPHGLDDPAPIVDFITHHAAPAARQTSR